MINWLTKETYLNAITVTNISQGFYLQDGGKSTVIDMEQNYVTVTLCIKIGDQHNVLLCYDAVFILGIFLGRGIAPPPKKKLTIPSQTTAKLCVLNLFSANEH